MLSSCEVTHLQPPLCGSLGSRDPYLCLLRVYLLVLHLWVPPTIPCPHPHSATRAHSRTHTETLTPSSNFLMEYLRRDSHMSLHSSALAVEQSTPFPLSQMCAAGPLSAQPTGQGRAGPGSRDRSPHPTRSQVLSGFLSSPPWSLTWHADEGKTCAVLLTFPVRPWVGTLTFISGRS